MNIYPAAIDHVTRYGEIYATAFSGEPWNDPWRPEDAEIHVRELLETKTASCRNSMSGTALSAKMK